MKITSAFRLQLRQDQRAQIRVLAALREQTMAQVLSDLIDASLMQEAKKQPLTALTTGGARVGSR
jgi:hypothetical protein